MDCRIYWKRRGDVNRTSHEARIRERISEIARLWHVEFAGNALVRTCSGGELGTALHEFGETAKTIGDAFLGFPAKPSPKADLGERLYALGVSSPVEAGTIPRSVDADFADFSTAFEIDA